MWGRREVANILEIEEGLRSADEKRRWAAAAAAGELVSSHPVAVWSLVVAHGSSSVEDVRAAVATCMLEHLLEEHFDEYFPLLKKEIRAGNLLLGDTLRRSWKFGQAEEPERSARWESVLGYIRARLARSTGGDPE
jgi:hypothetical protein